jgi:hypothetical protein
MHGFVFKKLFTHAGDVSKVKSEQIHIQPETYIWAKGILSEILTV